jgi:hypothetical protein
MAGYQDRDIGGKIIRLLMTPILPASRAARPRLEEAKKEPRFFAPGATTPCAARHRLQCGGWEYGWLRERVRLLVG